jgi:hypothetical protein
MLRCRRVQLAKAVRTITRPCAGNQGVALMLLAERFGDATRVQTAVQQIEVAFVTMRDGKVPAAAYDEAQLLKARALFDRLTSR